LPDSAADVSQKERCLPSDSTTKFLHNCAKCRLSSFNPDVCFNKQLALLIVVSDLPPSRDVEAATPIRGTLCPRSTVIFPSSSRRSGRDCNEGIRSADQDCRDLLPGGNFHFLVRSPIRFLDRGWGLQPSALRDAAGRRRGTAKHAVRYGFENLCCVRPAACARLPPSIGRESTPSALCGILICERAVRACRSAASAHRRFRKPVSAVARCQQWHLHAWR